MRSFALIIKDLTAFSQQHTEHTEVFGILAQSPVAVTQRSQCVALGLPPLVASLPLCPLGPLEFATLTVV